MMMRGVGQEEEEEGGGGGGGGGGGVRNGEREEGNLRKLEEEEKDGRAPALEGSEACGRVLRSGVLREDGA
eukprot:768107-Hanusia_phi.AAC.4